MSIDIWIITEARSAIQNIFKINPLKCNLYSIERSVKCDAVTFDFDSRFPDKIKQIYQVTQKNMLLRSKRNMKALVFSTGSFSKKLSERNTDWDKAYFENLHTNLSE